MKRVLFVCLFALMMVTAFAAVSLEGVLPSLPSSEMKALMVGEVVKKSSVSEDITVLAPKDCLIWNPIEEALSMKKGFSISIGSLIPYPEEWKTLSQEEKFLAMYNAALRVSTQKGITYISHRAGDKEKLLFEDSSMLGSPDKKDRIPDPVVSSIPENETYYALQDDTSFGKNVYRLNYQTRQDELYLSITNADDLSFMGINCVAAEKVKMFLDIIPVEEGIYVYGMASVRDKSPKLNLLVYKVDLELSFFNRIVALRDWYAASIRM